MQTPRCAVLGFLFAAACLSGSLLHAATPTSSPGPTSSVQRALEYAHWIETGERSLGAGNAAAAVAAFRNAIALFGDDGRSHRNLAKALLAANAFSEAARENELARQLGWGESDQMALLIASCHLRAGNRERALDWIAEALRSRLKQRISLLEDERFAALRTDPRFLMLAQGPATPGGDRVAGWSSDLDFLVSELRRLHPKFALTLPEGFASRAARLKSRLNQLTDQEIVLEVMALFATVGDAHTVLFPFGMKRGALVKLPLDTHLFSDGLYVVGAPGAYEAWIGARVERIGGRTVESLMAGLPEFVSRDNDRFVSFAAPFALSLPDLLRRLGAKVGKEDVELELARGDRSPATVRIPIPREPIDPDTLDFKLRAPHGVQGDPPLWLSRPDENFWLSRLSRATVFVQINQCHDGATETLKAFAGRLVGELQVEGTSNVIVDVRRNNGGDEDSIRVVAAALIAFQVHRPTARVFVLIGGNTLSAAQNFISTLDQWMDVEFAGEVSGSRPNHVGDDTLVVLPYSGLMGSIACAVHQTTFRDARPWIAPAWPVALSSRDYFAQRDPVLETVLEVIGRTASK